MQKSRVASRGLPVVAAVVFGESRGQLVREKRRQAQQEGYVLSTANPVHHKTSICTVDQIRVVCDLGISCLA